MINTKTRMAMPLEPKLLPNTKVKTERRTKFMEPAKSVMRSNLKVAAIKKHASWKPTVMRAERE